MTDDVDGQLAEPIPDPEAQPPADTAPPADAAPADTAPAAETQAAPDQAPEPKRTPWWQSRIDTITAQRYEEANARRAAEARAQALEALLTAQGVDTAAVTGGGPGGAPAATAAPSPTNPTDFQRAVQVEAARIAAQQAYTQRVDEVWNNGLAKHPEFKDSVETLIRAGVLDEAGSFLRAALATDAPEAVLNQLGQNPDEAARIASLPQEQRAIQLDRIARELATPKSRPVSSAPAPIAPIDGARVSKAFDPYDPKVSSEEWFREMDRRDAEKRAGRA